MGTVEERGIYDTLSVGEVSLGLTPEALVVWSDLPN